MMTNHDHQRNFCIYLRYNFLPYSLPHKQTTTHVEQVLNRASFKPSLFRANQNRTFIPKQNNNKSDIIQVC